MSEGRSVTLISHGPNCLDGLTCAVVAARYFVDRRFEARFASNRQIDSALRQYRPDDPAASELWVTDISWRDDATTAHLNGLVEQGLELYWVDHHKSAIDRRAEGGLDADFTDFVLTDEFSASRLLFHYLCDRVAERGESRPGLLALRNLVMLADDVDRWVLALDGSRNLALVVRAMRQEDAYRALLAMDSNITYNADLREAAERVERDLAITIDIAERTRADLTVPRRGLHVLAAECEGYTGEVAEHWQAGSYRTVFALYDRLAESVSFRRTPDCPVDLSRLAAHFGGGGHAAAAGCEYEISSDGRSQALAAMVADALDRDVDK
jgi:oligoribonuclease NrnB/cAMP/cGMP phosphodiesterase (DHH superfamily)